MQITLVPCPNGMGHFNRLIKLASYFNTTNINLVCTKEQERKFKNKLNINIKLRSVLHEINLKFNPYPQLLKFYNLNFLKYKFFYNSDIIISDNLINKDFYKKKFFMISNFFWSEVFYSNCENKKNYLKIEDAFIEKQIFFTNRYFCTKKAQKYGRKINFIDKKFCDPKKFVNLKKKKILIYLGKNEKISKDLYFSLINLNYKTVTNNNALIKLGCEKFDFSDRSFSNLKFIFAKAGLGSIFDSIKFQIPIIVFRNKKNLEYESNLKKILKYNIGTYIDANISKSSLEKKIYFINKKKYSKFLKNFGKFKFNGGQQIKTFLNNNEK